MTGPALLADADVVVPLRAHPWDRLGMSKATFYREPFLRQRIQPLTTKGRAKGIRESVLRQYVAMQSTHGARAA